MIISRSVTVRMRNVLRQSLVETKAHILCSVTFFWKNHAAYDVIWKNIVELERPHLAIWRMRIGYRLTKATHTHTHTHTHCFSTATVVARTCRNVTKYIHCLSCYCLCCCCMSPFCTVPRPSMQPPIQLLLCTLLGAGILWLFVLICFMWWPLFSR